MQNKYIILADGKSPHTLKWIKELSKYYELYLISFNGYNDEVLSYIDNNRIFNLTNNNSKLIRLSKFFKLIKIVKNINPKFLNAHYLSSYGFFAALIKRKMPTIKLIQSTWGTDILVTPFKNILNYKIAKFSLKYADIITSDSAYMSEKIKEIYEKSNILTFPFGLDKFKIEYFNKDEYLIFSNRALYDNYNIDKILKWFGTLNNKYKLIIANSGELEKKLRKLTQELNIEDRVKFVGFLSQIEQEQYYKNSKYYISIPTSDATSVSLLESMRYGCIPIVSNICANREWVLDGINGYYFDDNLELRDLEIDVIKLNQKIISKKAIFEDSIKKLINRINNL